MKDGRNPSFLLLRLQGHNSSAYFLCLFYVWWIGVTAFKKTRLFTRHSTWDWNPGYLSFEASTLTTTPLGRIKDNLIIISCLSFVISICFLVTREELGSQHQWGTFSVFSWHWLAVWSTGSWLLQHTLSCQTEVERKRLFNR